MSMNSKTNVLKKSKFNFIMHMLNTVLWGRQSQFLNGYFWVINGNTVELWSLELACLEHQGSLELVRRSRQFPYTFNVKIRTRLEQRWLELSNSKHGPQGDFFM